MHLILLNFMEIKKEIELFMILNKNFKDNVCQFLMIRIPIYKKTITNKIYHCCIMLIILNDKYAKV